MQSDHEGFTLIELMATLAVAAILLTVGMPSMREFIERNRVSAYTNLLVGALQLAKSEAIKRGNLVILCKSNAAGNGCNPSGAWKDGWLLYADMNADKAYTPGTDTLIRRHEATSQLSITTGSKLACWIGFSPNGIPEGSGTGCAGRLVGNDTFSICASNPSATRHGRRVIINSTGRIRTEDATC